MSPMNKGLITLTETEFKRHEILKRVIEGVLTSSEAAIALQLSQRQVRRLVKKLRESGPRALAAILRFLANCWPSAKAFT